MGIRKSFLIGLVGTVLLGLCTIPAPVTAADSSESALAQLLVNYYQLASAAASGHEVGDFLKGGQERIKEMSEAFVNTADRAFGKLVKVDHDGNLNVDLKGMMNVGDNLRFDLKGLINKKLSAGTNGLLGVLDGVADAQDRMEGVKKAFSFDTGHLEEFMGKLQKDVLHFSVNGPGKLHFRKQMAQLGEAVKERLGDVQACGTFSFNPGGKVLPEIIEGPVLIITQTTGNCALVDEVRGAGNTAWTQKFRRLACLGPQLSYSYTPVTWRSHSKEATSFRCPECKIQTKFGPEIRIELWGGSSRPGNQINERVKYTKDQFHKALVTGDLFGLNDVDLLDILKDLQGHIGKNGHMLSQILSFGPDTARRLQDAVSDATKNLQVKASSGKLASLVGNDTAGMVADYAMKMAQDVQQGRANLTDEAKAKLEKFLTDNELINAGTKLFENMGSEGVVRRRLNEWTNELRTGSSNWLDLGVDLQKNLLEQVSQGKALNKGA